MSHSRPPLSGRHFKPSDLRAVAQLATQATLGVMDMTEGVHQSVLRTVGGLKGRQPGRTAGITGLVYRSVRGITGLVGQGVDAALSTLEPRLTDTTTTSHIDSPEREQVLAALNGVLGDRLAASQSPLALDMAFRLNGQAWQPEDGLAVSAPAQGHVLLTIHGLCMTDTQWLMNGHDHGDWLAQAMGCTRLNLRYNTGLHVHDNGLKLARLLERLVLNWPVPLTRLSIVAHSMGGLVARSAHAAGVQSGHAWPQRLKDMVFLGTPHHGSPLERAGHWVDSVLAATPFTMPFVKLGQLRSAGIIDLRHGCVLPPDRPDEPDQPRALGRHADTRTSLPLPAGVNCFAVAATLAPRRSMLAERLTGDGLVPLHSALGQHDDPRHRLAFEPTHQHVMHRTGHLALLGSQPLAQHMLNWLQTPPTTQA